TGYRIWMFHAIDPRMDQAFMMDWVQTIAGADHVLPHRLATQSWIDAIEADDRSLVHALLKPIYVASTTLFLTGSVGWFLFGAVFSGVSATSQFAWSVVAHGLMLVLLAMLPAAVPAPADISRRETLTIGMLAALFAAAASFLHAFSPLGAHNVGL